MSWTMSSKREGGLITYRIGQLPVAVIRLLAPDGKSISKWQATLITFDSDVKPVKYVTVSEAMQAMHKMLNDPPKEKDNDNN